MNPKSLNHISLDLGVWGVVHFRSKLSKINTIGKESGRRCKGGETALLFLSPHFPSQETPLHTTVISKPPSWEGGGCPAWAEMGIMLYLFSSRGLC